MVLFLGESGFPYYRLGQPYPTTMEGARRFVVANATLAVDVTGNQTVAVHWPRDKRV